MIPGGLIIGFRVVLEDPATLAEGAGILIGALLAGFAMVAVWRDRLTSRHRTTEQVHVRALDEAAAHILIGVLVAMLVTFFLGAAANIDTSRSDNDLLMWIDVVVGGLGIAALAYIAAILFIVVNLLWDAYEESGSDKRVTH